MSVCWERRIPALKEEAGVQLQFQLKGPLSQLSLPSKRDTPVRKDGLYQHTCFEIFIREERRYLEWNFSPSGDWQQYAFTSYRAKFEEPNPKSKSIPFRNLNWKIASLFLTLDLFIPESEFTWLGNTPKLMSCCAVLEKNDGTLSYWAPTHHGSKPDFHEPKSFILPL